MSESTSNYDKNPGDRPNTASSSLIPPVIAPALVSAPSPVHPSLFFTEPTPQPSPISATHHRKAPTDPQTSILQIPSPIMRRTSSSTSKGKRKADEAGVDGGGTTTRDIHAHARATFVVEPRPHRPSANSNSTHAPSSYQRKRARLSATPEMSLSSATSDRNKDSRPLNSRTTGSWSSRVSRASGHAQSYRASPSIHPSPHRTPSRRSFSQASIPVSALISPHAPSIVPSSNFHMRDPRKPRPIRNTPWTLSLAVGNREPGEGWRGWVERGGSPPLSWLFFLGFLVFPIWWVASFTRIPRTRLLGSEEKGVLLDDPQLEYDARSWRKRCRVMSILSFFTYIPFIILVAVFTS